MGSPTELATENRRPWDRQPKESDQSFEAFTMFRNAGAKRSTTLVAQSLGKEKSLIFRWSSRDNWIQRAAEWDTFLDRQVQEKISQDHLQSVGYIRSMASGYITQFGRLLHEDNEVITAIFAEAKKSVEKGKAPTKLDRKLLGLSYEARSFVVVAKMLMDIDKGRLGSTSNNDGLEAKGVSVDQITSAVNEILKVRGDTPIKTEELIITMASREVGRARLGMHTQAEDVEFEDKDDDES